MSDLKRWANIMEFDSSVQNRWKASFACFGSAAAIILLFSLTTWAWFGLQWIAGAAISSLGILLALLSLAAKEKNRKAGIAALILNSIPIIVILTPLVYLIATK
jgi:VIT1/CCC1 family predicted Fe2+/Mn2+ transporter